MPNLVKIGIRGGLDEHAVCHCWFNPLFFVCFVFFAPRPGYSAIPLDRMCSPCASVPNLKSTAFQPGLEICLRVCQILYITWSSPATPPLGKICICASSPPNIKCLSLFNSYCLPNTLFSTCYRPKSIFCIFHVTKFYQKKIQKHQFISCRDRQTDKQLCLAIPHYSTLCIVKTLDYKLYTAA